MSYIGNEPVISATRTVTEISATAGQTTFTANGGYTVGYIDVFVNGSQLQTSDFTATNGTSVTLNAAAIAGDDVRLVAWGTFGIVGNQTIEFADGSASAPSITNAGDNNTGMFFPAADTIAFAEGGTEVARIDSSGNVGIGTASPSHKLDILGSGMTLSRIRGGTSNGQGAGFFVANNAGTSTLIGIGDDSTISGGAPEALTSIFSSKPLLFYSNSAERMRIDSSGNLLVGTTNTNSVSAEGFRYFGGSGNQYGGFTRTSAAPFYLCRLSSDGQIAQFFRDSTQVGSISVTTSNTSYVTTSDYRLKENIAPMTGALNTVAQLKPVTYTWKSTGSDGQGFIAHELQTVVPDAVIGEKDEVDADGKPVYQGVDTSFLVATLTAAIQELNAKVEAQAAEIETLKANQQGSV